MIFIITSNGDIPLIINDDCVNIPSKYSAQKNINSISATSLCVLQWIKTSNLKTIPEEVFIHIINMSNDCVDESVFDIVDQIYELKSLCENQTSQLSYFVNLAKTIELRARLPPCLSRYNDLLISIEEQFRARLKCDSPKKEAYLS